MSTETIIEASHEQIMTEIHSIPLRLQRLVQLDIFRTKQADVEGSDTFARTYLRRLPFLLY